MFRGACGSGGHTEDFNGYSHHSVAEFKKKKQNTHLKRKKGDVTTTKKERAWLIEKRKQK